MKKEAKEVLTRAISLHEKYDNKKDLSFALRYLGSIYRGERNFVDAKKNVTRALELAERIDAKQQVVEAHEELSQIYEAEGDLAKALDELRKYDVVKDTLFKDEKTKALQSSRQSTRPEKKESELKSLRQENEIKDSRLQRNQALLAGLYFSYRRWLFLDTCSGTGWR